MISSTQLIDGDEKGMGKSGPDVAHIYKPREMQPMKSPEPNGQKRLKGFVARKICLFSTLISVGLIEAFHFQSTVYA